METFTHAEGNLDDEVFEKSKSGSDTDVESGLEKLEGLGRLWWSSCVGGALAYLVYYYPSFVCFFGEKCK